MDGTYISIIVFYSRDYVLAASDFYSDKDFQKTVSRPCDIFLNGNNVRGQKRKLNLCVRSGSKHHGIQTVFHELLVNSHELGSEGFKVVDSLASQLHSVFVVSCHVSHLCLQLPVAVAQQLCNQTLSNDRIRYVNTCELKQYYD